MALVRAYQVQLDQEVASQNSEKLAAEKRDPRILDLRKKINNQTARLGEWAKKERRYWAAKSLELRQGTIGFKTGNRQTVLMRGWQEARSIASVLKAGRKFLWCLRIKYELNRQAILERTKPERQKCAPALLARFGLAIKQFEYFYALPKIDRPPAAKP